MSAQGARAFTLKRDKKYTIRRHHGHGMMTLGVRGVAQIALRDAAVGEGFVRPPNSTDSSI
eukprot:13238455-Heterocapsa_arctica.AAC.1